MEIWNEFKNLKEENKELNKILEYEKFDEKAQNSLNDQFKKENDIVLFSYRKENDSKNKCLGIYESLNSGRKNNISQDF